MMRSPQVRGWRLLLSRGERDGQLRVEEEVGSDGEVAQRGWRVQE